jgi:hypothetical protein
LRTASQASRITEYRCKYFAQARVEQFHVHRLYQDKINIFGVASGWREMSLVKNSTAPHGEMLTQNLVSKDGSNASGQPQILFDLAAFIPGRVGLPRSQV